MEISIKGSIFPGSSSGKASEFDTKGHGFNPPLRQNFVCVFDTIFPKSHFFLLGTLFFSVIWELAFSSIICTETIFFLHCNIVSSRSFYVVSPLFTVFLLLSYSATSARGQVTSLDVI